MDSSSIALQQALLILIYSSLVMLLIVSVFAVKLLKNTNSLVKKTDELAGLLKQELIPTLTELQKTLNIVNTAVNAADNQASILKKAVSLVLENSLDILGKAKGSSSNFMSGILAGIKILSKFKK